MKTVPALLIAALSSRPDAAGNPRLVAGFNGVSFEESDGSNGEFFGRSWA